MKSILIKTIAISLLLFVGEVGCNKEPILPPATESGLNTLGMLVNGQIWRPKAPITFDGIPALDIQFSARTKQLIIKARNYDQYENIKFFVEKINSIGIYKFSFRDNIRGQDTACHNCITCFDSTTFLDQTGCHNPYKLRDSINSSIQITKLDTLMKIASGTFSMTLENSDKIILNITNGRFDVRY